MEIDKVFSSDVDGVADNLFSAVKNSVSEIKAMQQRKAAENVQLVIQALKKIESDLQDKFDGVTTVIEKRVATIKDGRDGLDGRNGRDGKDGRPGRDGAPGARGPAGVPGTNGRDGEDGVSVTDARIDFDGSLIISLSSGREINVGEVVAPDLAEKIKVITNGGGTSQSVLDSLASLQAQITALSNLGAVNYVGTWDASTNTPTIVNGTGDKGDYYVVSVAGSTNIDGQTLWGVGDWIIFNGVVWQRVDGGSTGNFTDLSASGVVTLSGGTANGLAYLNGSKVLTTGSTLTFDGSRQIRLNFGGYTDWNTGYNTILVGASTVAGAFNSTVSHLASNLTDDTGSGGWRYVLSGSRASVLTQSNGTLTWSATTTTGSGGTSAASFLKPIISANFAGAITLNSSSDPGSLTHYGTATISDAVTLSGGTANGVAYLNGSKVLTTGSALTFDGTNLGLGTATPINSGNYSTLTINGTTGSQIAFKSADVAKQYIYTTATDITYRNDNGAQIWFGGSELMRLTSTGLGIGTSSPGFKLDVGGQDGTNIALRSTGTTAAKFRAYVNSAESGVIGFLNGGGQYFEVAGSEQMRLTSTGLGIGTSSPVTKLNVRGAGDQARYEVATATDARHEYYRNGSREAYINWDANIFTIAATQASGVLTFASGGTTERMRLDSSGNLGIGTSSPSARLHVAGEQLIQPTTVANAKLSMRHGSIGNNNYFEVDSSSNTIFGTANAERMRLDASGNLGLGVTPSAWSQGRAMELAGTGYGIWNGTGSMYMLANAYFNSGFKYANSGAQASHYYQYQGAHVWSTAPTGTAGNAISFTQAMTLDASGNLLVGGTTAVDRLTVTGNIATNGTQNYIYNNGGSGSSVNSGFFLDGSGNTLRMFTNNTERARIDSSGNLLVGTTSSSLMGGNSLKIDGGTDTTGGQYSFLAYHNNAAYYFGLNNNGYVQASAVYGRTTASAANVNVDASGYITRSTSARKYKQDIRDIEEMDISLLRPVRYKSKCESDDQTKDHLGVIADEAADAGFEELVTRGADGEVEGFQYERLTVVLLKELQSLRARVAQLESKGA